MEDLRYTPEKPKKKRKVSRFTKGVIISFIAVLAIAIAAFFIVGNFLGTNKTVADLWSEIKPIKGTPGAIAEEYPDVHRVNILILGASGKGPNVALADTIMLASYDMDNKRVDMISVPRDSYVERTDGYTDIAFQKINSYYGFGLNEDGSEPKEKYEPNQNPKRIARAVADILDGTPIHFYAVVSDEGIEKIVDAMGGITIDVPMNMKYTDKKQDLYINLKKGKQTLNGDQAVQYLRFRKGYAMGDLGRVKAQQKFVKEAFKQSIGLGLPKVASTVIKNVDKNISVKLAAQLAAKAVGMDKDSLDTKTIPGTTEMIRGGSFFLPDEAKTAKFMRKFYDWSVAENTKKQEEEKEEEKEGFLSCTSQK